MGIKFPLKCDLAYYRAQRTQMSKFTPFGIKTKILPNIEFDIVFHGNNNQKRALLC